MRALGEEEVTRLQHQSMPKRELRSCCCPDPRDDHNIFLEVRAGTGGDEAAIFAGDLFRMYAATPSLGLAGRGAEREPGRARRLQGDLPHRRKGAFSRLKFESGTHRVQRVPATEAQGRIHTSAVTVAILPELDEVEKVESIRPICASTPTAPRAPAASTSTRPIRRYASRTCRAASWWSVRMSAPSTRTARAPWRC